VVEWAQRLRVEVNQYLTECGSSMTVSIGVSSIHILDIITLSALVNQADETKNNGKNRVQNA
jgi:PleD family two-component response regulator